MRYFHIFAAAGVCLFLAISSSGLKADDRFNDFDSFHKQLSPAVSARLQATTKHYRQIEPSLYYLAATYSAHINKMSDDQQVVTLVKLAQFIDKQRTSAATHIVIGKDINIIGLLDPDRGLDPREITAIAQMYNASPTIFKKNSSEKTLSDVADDFLTTVSLAANKKQPTTIIVLGHGLPNEIQSYSIPCDRLADALLPQLDNSLTVDLGHLVLICDDCYSADFSINLAKLLEKKCQARSLKLNSMPVMIAGTNRDRVGHADFGEKFVPHFWKDVIELYYIRRPRQSTITLRDFFENVDNMMYGYGRVPKIDADGTVTYKLVNPELCQDPVVFVPLNEDDRSQLRNILGLPANEPLIGIFDIG